MRVPLSWLRDFSDCDLPPEELADRLTMGGLEVDAIERIGVLGDDVVVARVTRCESHPKADGLRVVQLDLGEDRTALAVTGAPNLRDGAEGELVIAALPGATLIDAKSELFALLDVAARPVMGVDSSAVLCSEAELGLSLDHSGVLILEEDEALPGVRAREIRPPGDGAEADVVLDVAVLPNQGRCLSIIGMAREVAALTRTSFRLELDAKFVPAQNDAFDIRIADPALCPRYSGLVVENVEARPSPRWMQRRLALAGHKPANILVDVTNYVMTEMGQPMHAFDLERLPARDIEVRTARAGESMHTLDQKTEPADGGDPDPPRELDPSTLLITSGGKPVAVAGVIGGLDSQIWPDTTQVFLESANFDPVSIRKTTARLKVNTDSSYRFAREVDPSLAPLAIQRATWLLEEYAGGTSAAAMRDVFPEPAERRELTVSARDVSRYLGLEVDAQEVASSLARLGFDVEIERDDRLRVGIPGFRGDVAIPADIAEEVIRVIGFDRLPARRLTQPLPRQRRNTTWDLRGRVRGFLAGAGLQDVITYSLTAPDMEARLAIGSPRGDDSRTPYVTMLNPVSQERSSMRRTLLAGLLETVERNHRQRERIALFEIGRVWWPEAGDGTLPGEPERVAIAMTGPVDEATWMVPEPRPADFFDVKGVLEGLFEHLHIGGVEFRPTSSAPWHPGIAAEVVLGDGVIGSLGEVHPDVLAAYDLGRRKVVAAEIAFAPLVESSSEDWTFRAYSRFPVVWQDLNLVVPEDVPSGDVRAAIRAHAGELLREIRVLDLWRGEQIGADKKSVTFRLAFGADDRSLSEDEVNAIRDGMLSGLREAVGAELR